MSRAEKYDETFSKYVRQLGFAVLAWGKYMEDFEMAGVQVTSIRVDGPAKTGSGFRVIVKSRDESGRELIAFGNGATYGDALLSVQQMAEARGLSWRDDVPWDPKKGKG